MGNDGKRNGALIALFIILLIFVCIFAGYKFITTLSPEVDSKFNEVAQDQLGIDIEAIREQRRADRERKKQEELARKEEKQRQKEEEKNAKKEDKDDDDDDDDDDVIFTLSSALQKIMDEPYTYKAQGTRSYEGPKIHVAGSYIFNTEGKILKDFYGVERYNLFLSMNVDGSEAVVIDDKQLFYLDADLNMTKIEDEVRGTGMCYEGGYFYYTKEVAGVPYEVYIYDVAAKKSTKVGESNISEAAISPDGQTVAYFKYDATKMLYSCKIGEEPKILDTGTRVSPITVSNDGQIVFYESFDANDGVYCVHNGIKTKISKEYIHAAYFDRDCTQILFEEPGKIKYYRAGDKSAVDVWNHSYYNYKIYNVSYMETRCGFERFIVDTDTFADVLTIDDYSSYYCLKGETPVMYKLGGDDVRSYNAYVTFGDKGPEYLYQKDANVYRGSYDGDTETSELVWDSSENAVSGFVANAETSEMWIASYTGKAIFYSKDGEDYVKVTGDDYKPSYQMQWNPLDGKCYYISDEKLYSVGDGSEEPSLVAEDVAWFSYAFSDVDILCYEIKDHYDEDYVIVFDEILPVK